MKKLRKLGLLGAAGVALIAALLAVTQASAGVTPGAVSLPLSVQTTEFGSAEVELSAFAEPGSLATWTIDVLYDATELNATECEGVEETSVCDIAYADGLVRVAGESADGYDGPLATLTFECKGAGPSLLELNAVLTGGTVGDPQDIDLVPSASDQGVIFCGPLSPEDCFDLPRHLQGLEICEGVDFAAGPEPTSEPATAEAQLPDTGFGDGGGSGSGSGSAWIIAALAAAGLAGIAGFGALRLRRN